MGVVRGGPNVSRRLKGGAGMSCMPYRAANPGQSCTPRRKVIGWLARTRGKANMNPCGKDYDYISVCLCMCVIACIF